MVRVRLPTADGNTHIKPIGLYITMEESNGLSGADKKQIFVRFAVGYMDNTTFVRVHTMEVSLNESHIESLGPALEQLGLDMMNYMLSQGLIHGTIE